jgi:hypothetical protein
MRVPVQGYEARFGIARNHWLSFQRIATQMNKIILVRGGKEKAIPWIKRGFPAKPLELKIKVDPNAGLLVAQQHEYSTVFKSGHYVVVKSGGDYLVERKPASTLPLSQVAPNLQGMCSWTSWVRPGLVLDRESGLPFTSDYDIAAVIDLDDPRWGRTHLSEPQLDTPNLTSRFVQPVVDRVNAAMTLGTCVQGQPRARHGTQAQIGMGSPMHDDKDVIIVFYPKDYVEQLSCRNVAEGREELKNILRESLPATGTPGGGKVIKGPWR